MADLARRGVMFSDSTSGGLGPIGRLARFTDPAGHVLLLREPSPDRETLTAPVALAAGTAGK